MKRIVIGTDSSPGSRAAMHEGLDLARRLGAAVTFVTVRHPIPLLGDPYYQRRLSQQLRQARAVLDEAKAEAERLGVDVDSEIAEGDAVDEILRTAQYAEADLIVVGSRGLGPVAGAVLGSVSRVLVQYSPIPELVVKEPVGVRRQTLNLVG